MSIDASPGVTPVAETDVERLLDDGAVAARTLKRVDIERELLIAHDRIRRSSGLICIVGSFKQGKSLLVNALLGADVSPVDDDLATVAVTVLYHRDEPLVRVRRTVDSEVTVEEVPFDEIDRFVSERDNTGNVMGVEVVEIGFPNPFLAAGISLVDTPGVGALRAGSVEAVLGFLPFADVLLFVTDASAPLTAAELAFLHRAAASNARVLLVVTKIDMYLQWQRMAAIDRSHLEDAGLDIEVYPVSPVVGRLGLEREDPVLGAEGGMDGLVAEVHRAVAEARRRTVSRALEDLDSSLDAMRRPLDAELRALQDPEDVNAAMSELRAARDRIVQLRGAGGSWRQILADGIEDVSDVYDDFAKAVRALADDAERRINEIDPGAELDAIEDDLKREMVSVVTAAFDTVSDRGAELAQRVADLLPDLRPPDLGALAASDDFDFETTGGSLEPEQAQTRSGLGASSLAALRGTQGGLITLGMLTSMAGLPIGGPLLLGVGGLMGVKQVRDLRKRGLLERRRETIRAMRRFVEAASTEARGRLRATIRELRRLLRDHYEQQFTSLANAYTEAAQAGEQAVESGTIARAERLALLQQQLAALDDLVLRTQAAVGGRDA